MNKLFYAVCDEDGICSFSNDKYPSLKALFYDKEQAELLVSNNNKDSLLIIVPVYIAEAR
ncbi:hypothetical protein [Xenorhabdus bovienii]|uniref:Uncharacterized protein n=1 Tax=Xenorhabdus bovienii str. Intermedium TaxID=1379677 RepID=A0A077QI08_XENBV|nr:hypothetical protein [Xenorhabdus bovienii]CDH32850.1 hypothetical protein XBI1_2270002 [Xenorhabdus bovienii str. Intermedium]